MIFSLLYGYPILLEANNYSGKSKRNLCSDNEAAFKELF